MTSHLGGVLAAALIFGFTATNATFAQSSVGSAIPNAPLNVFYSDPINGSMTGDGSQGKPWGSFQQIVAAKIINGQDNTSGKVHAGDLVYLLNGNHGSISLGAYSGKYVNTDFITIQAYPNHTPKLTGLFIQNCARWVFRGLTVVNPPTVPQYYRSVNLTGCNNMILDANTIYSVPDVTQWTSTDWTTSCPWYLLYSDGNATTITNNRLYNMENGIYIAGDSVVLSGNLVDYFANDGIDFTASNAIISRNIITNHYSTWDDGQHHDGMQGWTVGGKVTSNVVIDSNLVMASTGTYSTIPVQPTGIGNDYLQGICIFNGAWTNITATNNVILAAAYHGLSFYGVSNSVIANNTVLKQDSNPQYALWIGTFSGCSNVVVRNNLANCFALQTGAVDNHNISLVKTNTWSRSSTETVVTDPTTIFVKYKPATGEFDLNLKPGSPAISAGLVQSAPPLDFLGRPRSTTTADDGAYAYVGN